MDYRKFVYDFHKTMIDHQVTLVYEGEINQAITRAFSALTEKNMNEVQEDSTTVKRVYHVMVECLQNICKHAEDMDTEGGYSGTGIFMVGQSNNAYSIMTGNTVSNEKKGALTEMLTRLNEMDHEQVKDYYKKVIKESKLSDKGGAGLGFIDIVKKTGNKIDFHFEPIDHETSFFILVSKIDKI